MIGILIPCFYQPCRIVSEKNILPMIFSQYQLSAFQGSRGLLKKIQVLSSQTFISANQPEISNCRLPRFTESKMLDHSNYCKAPALPEIRDPYQQSSQSFCSCGGGGNFLTAST